MTTPPSKPAYGAPCNGCGLCCLAEQCVLSQAIFGDAELCPALQRTEAGFACGLITDTASYVEELPAWGGPAVGEAFGLLLGAGLGCDTGYVEKDGDETIARGMDAKHARNLALASPAAQALYGYFNQRAAA